MKRKRRNIGDRVQLIVDEVLYLFGHTSPSSADAARGRSLQLTRLEERVLMSASPMAMIAEVAMVAVESSPVAGTDAGTNTAASTENIESSDLYVQGQLDTANAEAPSENSENGAAPAESVRGIELIVIDSRVQDADTLLANLLNTDRDFRLLRLDANSDGLTQISEKLEQLRNVTAIHLLTHGNTGEILVGSTVLNAHTLAQHAPELVAWQHNLTANADILLYGCDVAATTEGKDFVESLHKLTSADVAASFDETGHEVFGGNWDFEYTTGDIESSGVFTQNVQQTWRGKLASINVNTFADTVDGDTSSVANLLANKGIDGSVSLREAILAINAGPGGDTINLGVGTYTLSRLGAGEDLASTGDLDILKSVTIIGTGAGTTTINGNGIDRIFEIHSGTFNVSGVTIQGGNVSITNKNGGGLLVGVGASATVTDSVFTGNSAKAGGAVSNEWTLTLANVSIQGNNSGQDGGGIAAAGVSTTLVGVTVSNNTTTGNKGGGIYANGGTFSATNVTISGNSSASNGGGISANSSVALQNVTITNNSAVNGSGVYANIGSSVNVRNSIVAGNNSSADIDGVVSFVSQGNNLIGNQGTATGFTNGVNSDQVGTGASPLNPLLGSLQNNGGATFTHAILAGSTAINAGTATGAPTTDQRGTPRIVPVDIGSYEYVPTLVATGELAVNVTTGQSQETSGQTRGSTQAVSIVPSGNYVVVWTSNQSSGSDANGRGVLMRVFRPDGTPLTGEIQVNQTITSDQQWATVSTDDAGNGVVVWTSTAQDNGSSNGVYARRFNATGAFAGNEFLVNTTTAGAQENAVVDMSGSGAFVVAWSGSGTGDTDGVFYRRFDASGNALDATERVANATNRGVELAPAIAMNDAGQLAITWHVGNDLYTRNFAANGTAVTTDIQVDSALTNGYGAGVGIDASGRTVVVYRTDGLVGVGSGVFAIAFNWDGTQRAVEFSVASGMGTDQTAPSIAMDDAGNFIVTYQSSGDGSGNAVFVQRYDSNFNALGSALRANITTAGKQQMASVAMRDQDSYVVVWSEQGPGDSDGVFARQFSNAGTAPVITSNGGGSTSVVNVAENTTAVTTVTATDADLPAQTLNYSISGGADSAKFSINTATGVLSFITAPDFETPTDAGTDNIYEVTVQVSDGAGGIATQAIAVSVAAVTDNNPVITSNGGGPTASINVVENSTVVTIVSAIDADLPSQTLTYSISGGADASKFAINSTTGDLSFVTGRNYEAPSDSDANNVYDVIVMVSDGSLNDTQAISVTVTNSTTGDVLTATQDTYINISPTTLNYGQSTSLVVDKSGSGIGNSRALLLFDLADIPANVTITSATLAMQATQNSGPFDINVYQVTQAWQEGSGNGTAGAANWTQRQTGVNWSATGGAYANTVLATLNTGATGQHTWDVTSLVADWHAANKVNYGVILGSPNLGSGTVTYDSSEGAMAPQLLVSFDASNGPPIITSNGGGSAATVSVAENTIAVTTVAATDVKLPGQTLTYSISGGADAANFVINGSTGVLTFVSTPNFETPTDAGTDNTYDVIVRVSDGIATDDQAITLNITPVNDNNPIITSNDGGGNATINVAENTTAVTAVTATDADLPAQTLTYSISGGADASKFAINSSTGVLTFVSARNFESPADVGANNIYDVTVQVSDGTLTDTQQIGVHVTNVNEAPTANAGGPYALSEGDALTVAAGLSVDPEGLPLAYAWDIDGDGLFNDATGSTATLTWSQLNSLASPINDNGTRSLAVRVTDAGGISTVATTGLMITNTAPTGNVTGNATTSSGMPYVISFSTADPGADTITMYRINWGDGTTEDISGTAASATHTYLVPGGTRSITATATDEDGTFPLNGGPWVVTVLNTAPTAPTLSDSVVPGLKNGAVVGTLSFSDSDFGDSHTWTVSDNRFKVEGSILKLKSSKQLNPVTEPTVTLTVTVTDANGASGASTFTLRVNNPPVSTSDAYLVDGTQQLSISSPALGVLANDIDLDGDPFTANLVSGPNHAATFGLNADGTFWYRAAAGYSGVDTFRYQVTDGENLGAVTTVTLTVNQPATLTYTALISAVPEQQTLSSPLKVGTFTIVDDGFGTNTLTLIGTDAALFALDSDNNLFLKAGLTIDFAVKTRFQVTGLVDDFAIAGAPDSSLAQVISVQNLNDAPTASALPNFVILEDAPAGTINTATAFFDKDGDALSYTLQAVAQTPGLIKTLSINQTTGVITYSLNSNAFGSAILRVTGKDPSNATASSQFQLNVQPVNDAPVALGYSASTFSGQALTSPAAGVLSSVTDVDLDPLAVTLVSGTTNGTVVMQANGSFVYTPNAGFQGTDTFSFVVSDGILLSNIGTASISVLPPYFGQQSGSSSGSSGFGTPISTTANGTTGSTSTGSGTVGSSGPVNSGAAGSPPTTGSGSSTGVVTGSSIPGGINPVLSGATNPASQDSNDKVFAILAIVEEVSTKRINVAAIQNSIENDDRNTSSDVARRATDALASHSFDATFSQSDKNSESSSLNAERETLYKQLAGRVDRQSDAVVEQLKKNDQIKGRVVGSVGVVTTGFSVGYLFWAVRLGTLASGLLAQVPAWSMLDPLLVIDGNQKEDDDDKESLQNIMDRQQAKVNRTKEPVEIDQAVST